MASWKRESWMINKQSFQTEHIQPPHSPDGNYSPTAPQGPTINPGPLAWPPGLSTEPPGGRSGSIRSPEAPPHQAPAILT